MNPLLIIGGLGILGFVLMGYKKKPAQSWVPYLPEPGPSFPQDPNEPPRLSRLTVVPGRIA